MKNKKMILLTALFLSILSACAVRSITPGDTMEVNMDFDIAAADMRHGWAFLTPLKITSIGSSDADSIKKGEKLFTTHCQKCHGPSGAGNGPLAKKLKINPTNLQNLTSDISNTYLVVQINDGKGEMPKWQDFLTQRQTYDLTNYIRTLKEKFKKKE